MSSKPPAAAPPAAEPVPVSHLDFGYVQACSDPHYLARILAQLRRRSTAGGSAFPELERAALSRLRSLNPHHPSLAGETAGGKAGAQLPAEAAAQLQRLEAAEAARMRGAAATAPVDVPGDLPPIRRGADASCATSVVAPVMQRAAPGRRAAKAKPDAGSDNGADGTTTAPTPGQQELPRDTLSSVPPNAEWRALLAEHEKTKGNEAMRTGDFEEALAYYSRSLSALETVAARCNRCLALIKCRRFAEADSDATAVLAQEETNVKARYRRACARLELERVDEAIADLRRCLELEPNQLAAQKLLQQCLAKQEATKGSSPTSAPAEASPATQSSNTAPPATPASSAASSSSPPIPPRVAAAKATASEKFAAGQYTEALEHYRSAQALLEAEANAVKIHTQLLVALINNQAACLLKLGDDRACCDLCDKVLQLEPGNVKALLRRAMANEHRERYVQARADFKAAAQRAPGLQAAVDGAARMSKMLRSLEGSDLLRKKAAKAEAKAEEVQPLVVEKPTSSADVTKPAAMATSKTDSATAGPFSSASSKPATPAAKTPTTAKDHYEKLKAAGNAHVQAGRFAEAAKAYGQCIALDASNPAAFNNRSLCWLKLGAYGKAEADATLVLYHEPTNVKALYRRALARKEQDDMLGAIEDLERLLQLEPQNTAAASELATLYDKSKKGGAPKESRKTASAAAVATEEAKPAVKTEPAASKPAPSKVPAAAAGGKDKATPLIQELSSTSSPTTAKPTATLQASSAKVASPVASLTSAKTTPAKPAAAPPAATATPKPSLPPKTTPTTTPAASAPSLVSQPPLRAVDFWRAFNQYRRQPPQLAEVLLSVPAAKLASYLDNQLEAEDAEAIVASLAHAATQQATEDVKRVTAAAYSRLRALAQTSRLDIAVALMDDDQRRATAAAASTICDAAQRVGVDIDAAGLDEVRRAFTD